MPHLALTFDLDSRDPEVAEDACFEAGASAVTLTDARDDAVLEPAPGEVRLWPATRMQALFDAVVRPESAVGALAAALDMPADHIQVELLADRAWEREWLKDFHAMRFGRRLWVSPKHEQVSDPDAVIVWLDPGLAFGTGTHATTALCLEWLDANPPRGGSVIDYGCGSGILAIAALKLGAQSAACFDIDPQAMTATQDNSVSNNVEARMQLCDVADQLPETVDVLLANILSGPLCSLAEIFAAHVRPGGHVVLSGLMAHEAPEVTGVFNRWFDMQTFGSRENWVALAGRRRVASA